MEAASSKILEVRRSAGNDCHVCPTCNKPAAEPWRHLDKAGNIIYGCIDAAHTASLEGQETDSAKWHFRPVAVKQREESFECRP